MFNYALDHPEEAGTAVAAAAFLGGTPFVATGTVGSVATVATVAGCTKYCSSAVEKTVYVADKFKSLTSTNARYNLQVYTGRSPAGYQAHHLLPQKFNTFFSRFGININDPSLMRWWRGDASGGTHQSYASQYNSEWANFINRTKNITIDKILEFAGKMDLKYSKYYDTIR